MPEEKERPRPHGDPLKDEISGRAENPGENQAQVQTDATPDVAGGPGREDTDRDSGRGSDANGVPAFDEADGAKRKRQYRDGAELVSGSD